MEDAKLNLPVPVVGPRIDTENWAFAIIEDGNGRIQIQSQTEIETEMKFGSYACES